MKENKRFDRMKDEYDLKDMINQFAKEISYYSQMEALGVTPYEKNYHQNLIKERTEELIIQMERYVSKAGNPVMQQFPENVPESVPELPPLVAPPPLDVPEQAPETAPPAKVPPVEQKAFTLEELKYYNGENGRAAYVAVNGVVYDVSRRIGWAGGTHFGLFSGNDLSQQFMACHRGLTAILDQLPVVGILVSE
ncbi:cytochrome b5 domain-containing protein [Anaerocolumna sp. MB42-C2]|uniref:cytochrome b5 domain-containing protein n=1 Tax=Anaerocolumna sp. MB42-C2 TaxID=3070997 RepID=UPI0027E0E5B4|nr:cytochrome b5 domain-containing protein [Anaerocolumna sp. MB42-C2]WMJ86489.1 cytochrome b5 domain-containing protein [Anaerocolumna sp. MB42-C2]